MASAVTAGLFLLGFPVKARLGFSSRQRTRCFPHLLPVLFTSSTAPLCELSPAAWPGLSLYSVFHSLTTPSVLPVMTTLRVSQSITSAKQQQVIRLSGLQVVLMLTRGWPLTVHKHRQDPAQEAISPVELLMATEQRLAPWAGSWVMYVSWFRSQMMQVLSSDPLTIML